MGYSCGIHCFGARGENYPPTKAMVNHDHDRIEAIDQGKVGDKLHGEVPEGTRALEGKGGYGWDRRIGEDFMCLTNYAPGNVFLNVGGNAWPPVILGKEGDGAKVTTMATLEGVVSSSNQVMAGWFWDIEVGLVIESSVVKGPVFNSRSVKEEEFLFHLVDSLKD